MVFNSDTGREAQAKRKTHGTGAYLKHLRQNDPELFARIQAAQVKKYGGPEGYKQEMRRRVKLRWQRQEEAEK